MALSRTAWMAAVGLWALTGLPAQLRSENYLFIRGDFHADGSLDVSDAITLIFHLFHAPQEPACLDAGDADDDANLDIADVLYMLRFLFAGGPAVPAPFPDCAPDPSRDRLGCAEQASCPPVTNEIVDIRRGNTGIEIEVFSSAPFPARALAPVLCIGGEGFNPSPHSGAGSENTLFFCLSEEEFDGLRQGDPVTIQHGGCTTELDQLVPFWDLWVFGSFDRSLLDG